MDDHFLEKGSYTLDGDWVPEGKGYNIDGDLVDLKPGVLAENFDWWHDVGFDENRHIDDYTGM